MKKIKLGVVGLGGRGESMIHTLLTIDGVEISAVCDVYKDRVENAAKAVCEKGFSAPEQTCDYCDLLNGKTVNAVYIATSWETHIPVAIDFLRAGIPVALEVGGSLDIAELWALVDAWEETKTPFMFMENCCYGKDELLGTALARRGILGEIVHCSGQYGHDLRQEVATGKEKRHYRLQHYLHESCENYPTHGLGPIAKQLDINRGNRMVSLVSVASKAAGMKAYVEKNEKTLENKDLQEKEFKQGDIVDTIITCENGETIRLCLDTTLPRSYDRAFTVRGTEGLYNQSLNYVYSDGMEESFNTLAHNKKFIDNAAKYEKEYLPDIWKNVTDEELESGHGGMDVFVCRAFADTLRNNSEMPIDVYDAAAWMCITALSAESIKRGGAPVQIPDFTRGKYKNRPSKDVLPL